MMGLNINECSAPLAIFFICHNIFYKYIWPLIAREIRHTDD